jgi:hypothetical protein
MRHPKVALLGLSAALLGAAPPSPPAPGSARVDALAHRVQEDWDFLLPDAVWHDVDAAITIGARSFAVDHDGPMKMRVDSDGDGSTDIVVQGAREFVTLRAPDAGGGAPFVYAIRLENDTRRWRWTVGHSRSGRVRGQQMHVFDLDGDGRYDEFGTDGLVLGAGRRGSFLSRVVHVGDELLTLHVAADGSSVRTEVYEGSTGLLDLHSSFEAKGHLESAIVRSAELSFNLAGAPRGMRVPVGTYRFAQGVVARRDEIAQIYPGRMRPIDVTADAVASLAWGGPVVAEFDYSIQGGKLTVFPDVRFLGSAGEEYRSFAPNERSPQIVVRDKGSGRVVQRGRFGGC